MKMQGQEMPATKELYEGDWPITCSNLGGCED